MTLKAGDFQIYNINLHLNGGKTEKDVKIRLEQVEDLRKRLETGSKINSILISGDFNTEIEEIKDYFNTKLNLTYTFKSGNLYNTENRVQYRNRDG